MMRDLDNHYSGKLDFTLTKKFLYEKCVERVERKRCSFNPPISRDSIFYDPSLLSKFFNCKTSSSNTYLITPKLLRCSNESGEEMGFVKILDFKDEEEVLWGDNQEFRDNLFSIFTCIIQDIMSSDYEGKDYIDEILCDNIIYAKFSSFRHIKDKYKISLLPYFGIWDSKVEDDKMRKYIDIACDQLYHKANFAHKFEKVLWDYSRLYKDYSFLDTRLRNDLLPSLFTMLEDYTPSSNSLGLRVNALINTDLIKSIDQIDAMHSCNDYMETPEFHLNQSIIHAASNYILELENIALSALESGTYIYGW